MGRTPDLIRLETTMALAPRYALEEVCPTPMMNTQEVADRLGTSKNKVYRLHDTGELRAFHSGHIFRFRQEDVAEFIVLHLTP